MDIFRPFGQDPHTIQEQFILPFGFRRLSPLEIYVMPHDDLLDQETYRRWIHGPALRQELSRRKWRPFTNIVNRYKGKLFHLDGRPFIFDDVRDWFTADMEWFSGFIRLNPEKTGPASYKGADHRVSIIELTLRLRRIAAYRHLMELKRHRLLSPQGEERLTRMLFKYLPPDDFPDTQQDDPPEDD